MESSPIPLVRLSQLANEACDSIFQSASSYEHSQTSSWNTNLINTILRSLISETTSSESSQPYKFAVNSTIIQHAAPLRAQPPSSSSHTGADEGSISDGEHTTAGSTEGRKEIGQGANHYGAGIRGMHSASGAYWNTEKDGMWSYKYAGRETRDFDVVLSVIWVYNT